LVVCDQDFSLFLCVCDPYKAVAAITIIVSAALLNSGTFWVGIGVDVAVVVELEGAEEGEVPVDPSDITAMLSSGQASAPPLLIA